MLRILLAIFLPFIAFFTIGRPISGIICLMLALLSLIIPFSFFGLPILSIWAVWATWNYLTDKKIEDAIRNR